MKRLIRIASVADIPEVYRNTPLSLLLEYHNLKRTHDAYNKPQLLIGMCMDYRKYIEIPRRFAYVMRAGGANLLSLEFGISYAIAVGGVRHIAVIGHNECGMAHLGPHREDFIRGLMEGAGWERKRAEEHFQQSRPAFETGDEIDFVFQETRRFREDYPKIVTAPFLYRLEDHLLYLIRE